MTRKGYYINDQYLTYFILDNPVRSDIVDHPEEYRYSSARNYLGGRTVCLKWNV